MRESENLIGRKGLGVSPPTATTALSSLRDRAASRLVPAGFDRLTRRSGPYGIDCTCDVWAPCDSCARLDQIEEAQMADAFARVGEPH